MSVLNRRMPGDNKIFPNRLPLAYRLYSKALYLIVSVVSNRWVSRTLVIFLGAYCKKSRVQTYTIFLYWTKQEMIEIPRIILVRRLIR
jgi:hypothetical protein